MLLRVGVTMHLCSQGMYSSSRKQESVSRISYEINCPALDKNVNGQSVASLL